LRRQPLLHSPNPFTRADCLCSGRVLGVLQDAMAPDGFFDASNKMLKAGEDKAIDRDEGSELGTFSEVIVGGGIALRYTQARAQSVPTNVRITDVEIVKYVAEYSLAGEWVDSAWWTRVDEFSVPASDENYEKFKTLKRTWARVNKEGLPEPLYAPRFPGTAGSAADWEALTARAVELHNEGKVPGLIGFGAKVRHRARSTWRPSTSSSRRRRPVRVPPAVAHTAPGCPRLRANALVVDERANRRGACVSSVLARV